jgi:hypothetical protein
MGDLTDYKAVVAALVPGTHPASAGELSTLQERAVNMAFGEHSRFRPVDVVEDVTADGGRDYTLSDLASWVSGFSVVNSVQYPFDDTEETATTLEQSEDWSIYEEPSGAVLRFATAPDSGDDFRIKYTGKHAITDDASSSTLNPADVLPTQSLAAGFYARMISAYYALDQDPTISADSVNHSDRMSKYEKLAQKYFSEYYQHVGVSTGKGSGNEGGKLGVGIASTIKDWDMNASMGYDRLTHPRRYR